MITFLFICIQSIKATQESLISSSSSNTFISSNDLSESSNSMSDDITNCTIDNFMIYDEESDLCKCIKGYIYDDRIDACLFKCGPHQKANKTNNGCECKDGYEWENDDKKICILKCGIHEYFSAQNSSCECDSFYNRNELGICSNDFESSIASLIVGSIFTIFLVKFWTGLFCFQNFDNENEEVHNNEIVDNTSNENIENDNIISTQENNSNQQENN